MYIVNLYNVKWNKKYTQKQIMQETGLSKKVVSQLFSGKYHNYTLETLEKIAEFLNCTIHDILINIDEKKK